MPVQYQELDFFATLCPISSLEHPLKEVPDYSQCPNNKDIFITIRSLPLNTTLKQYTDFAWNFLNLTHTNYNPIQRNFTNVSGIPAESNTYTYLDEFEGKDEIIKTLEVITVFGNRAYEITFSSPQFDFDDLLSTVQTIINSIKILPMPRVILLKMKQ